MMNAPRGGEHICRWGYRALLRLYPAHFRDTFGLEMEETFADQWRSANKQGVLAALLLLAASVTDVLSNGLRERLAPQPKGSGMFHFMDVRYAFRLLRRSPMFSLLTVLVLSGGLGLAIFTFSFLHTAMLKPIPVADGERVVRLMQERGPNISPFDAADAAVLRDGARTLSEMGAYTSQAYVLGDTENPRVVESALTDWNVFAFTRSNAMLGRTYVKEDAIPGAEPVVVLSHRLWRAAFGSDSSIVNRTVLLDGTSVRVIGVMPATYGFPVASEAWRPL
ncbi:MAG: ABC transporter permease, partial [Phycisphaerae bacterium]|nr:ABC transporter permease [Gemmatimonadaceae bacterium]